MNEKTILIADDDKDLANSLAMRCRQLGLKVMTVHSGVDAVKMADEIVPDLICLDVNMPCGNGPSICELLTTHERLAATPVIVMTGDSNDETVQRCHELSAYYVEKCSNVWQRLEPLIAELLELQTDELPDTSPSRLRESNRKLIDVVFDMLGADTQFLAHAEAENEFAEAREESSDSRPWVLCIDDDADYSLALKLRLETHGIDLARAFEGMDGFVQAFMRPADVILLDYEMPNGQGDYILRRLKENPITKDIPVISVTGRRERSIERKMLSLGAALFMNKPIDFDRLLAGIQEQIATRKQTAVERHLIVCNENAKDSKAIEAYQTCSEI